MFLIANPAKAPARKDTSYSISVGDIKTDLTDGKGRPKWLLSSYGPGKNPPASLLEGSEYSFEEIRVRFYELRTNGKVDEANQEAGNLWQKAEQGMSDVLNNIGNVVNFMEDAEKKHPNRFDFTKVDGTKTRDQVAKESESGSSIGGSSGFGQPSGFTKPTTTFGQPTPSSGAGSGGFGQPAQPSSFGNPSVGFGQPATSTFGKPSIGFGQQSFGQSAQPVFGQPAAPAPVFGQPTAQAPVFGQPAAPAPGFGQTAQPASVFGQPAQSSSSFVKPAFGSSGFGQPSILGAKGPFAVPSTAKGFGQPSFGQSSFGQPSQPNPAFGQPSQPTSGFGQAPQPSTGFGKTAQPSPFGQPSQQSPFLQPSTTLPGFGQPTNSTASELVSNSAFGKASTTASTFGQPPAHPSNRFGGKPENNVADLDNPMTSPTFNPASRLPMSSNPFGVSVPTFPSNSGITQMPRNSSAVEVAVLPPNNNNSSSTPHPLTNKAPRPLHYTETIPATAPTVTQPTTGKLQGYRGRRVQYINDSPCYERPDGKGWERIWFPQDGQTQDVVYLGRQDKVADLVAEQERYTDEVTQQFAFLFDMGKFKDGKMPSVPPRREWCLYDF